MNRLNYRVFETWKPVVQADEQKWPCRLKWNVPIRSTKEETMSNSNGLDFIFLPFFCWTLKFVQSNTKPTLNILIAVRAHHSSKSDNNSEWIKYLVTSRRLARTFVLIRQCRKVNLVSSIADSPGWWVGVSGVIINRKYFKQVVINPWPESMHSEDLCRGVKAGDLFCHFVLLQVLIVRDWREFLWSWLTII